MKQLPLWIICSSHLYSAAYAYNQYYPRYQRYTPSPLPGSSSLDSLDTRSLDLEDELWIRSAFADALADAIPDPLSLPLPDPLADPDAIPDPDADPYAFLSNPDSPLLWPRIPYDHTLSQLHVRRDMDLGYIPTANFEHLLKARTVPSGPEREDGSGKMGEEGGGGDDAKADSGHGHGPVVNEQDPGGVTAGKAGGSQGPGHSGGGGAAGGAGGGREGRG